MESVKLYENTWRIEDGGVRFFLLCGSSKAILIDTGMTGAGVRQVAKELTDLPIELINTHADIDHIGGNKDFDKTYMHPAELYNYNAGEISPVWDGDIIELGNRKLKVIHTPGHTPGSIALLDVNNRALFSGDPIQDGNIFMFGNQRDLHAYKHSMIRIKNLQNEFDKIYPSHGSVTVDINLVDKLIEGVDQILEKQIVPIKGELFNAPINIYDVGVAKFLCEYTENE